jgi:hypothetical protein
VGLLAVGQVIAARQAAGPVVRVQGVRAELALPAVMAELPVKTGQMAMGRKRVEARGVGLAERAIAVEALAMVEQANRATTAAQALRVVGPAAPVLAAELQITSTSNIRRSTQNQEANARRS